MGETTDQIEQHIYEKRQELDGNIHELQHKVKRAVDWRAQVEERPWKMMGLAFGAGALASVLIARRSRASRHARRSSRSEARSSDGKSSQFWDIVKSGVMAVVIATAKDLVEQIIPGFRGQYRKRASESRLSGSRSESEYARSN